MAEPKEVEDQSSDLSIHATIDTQTSAIDESILGTSPNTADREEYPEILVEHADESEVSSSRISESITSGPQQQPTHSMSIGNSSNITEIITSTVGMLGETITGAIRKLSDTALEMSKYYWSDSEVSENPENKSDDTTKVPTGSEGSDKKSAERRDEGGQGLENSIETASADNTTTAKKLKDKLIGDVENTAKQVVAQAVEKALKNDSKHNGKVAKGRTSVTPRAKSADSKATKKVVSFRTFSSVNVRDPKAVKDLIRLMQALKNDASLVENLLELATTSEVRVALRSLASEAAAGDGILSEEVQRACENNRTVSPTSEHGSSTMAKDQATLESDRIRQSKTNKSEYTSSIRTSCGSGAGCGSALCAFNSGRHQPRQRPNSWVDGALDSVEPQKVSVCSVQKLKKLPDDGKPELFNKLVERNSQFLEHNRPAFESIVMQAQLNSEKVNSNGMDFDRWADSEKRGTVVTIDSQASAFLDTISRPHFDEEISDSNIQVELPSSIMVFGAQPSKGPASKQEAVIADVFNRVRNASVKPDKKKRSESSSSSETDDEKDTSDRGSEDDDDKKSSQKELKNLKGRIPCGVCPCCKMFLKNLGEYSSESCSESQTVDEKRDLSSSVSLSDFYGDNSDNDKREAMLDDELRKRDPKEWLRCATAMFLKRDSIRQLVLNQHFMRGDGNCKSRTPSPLQNNITKYCGKARPKRVRLEIQDCGKVIDCQLPAPRKIYKAYSENGSYTRRKRRVHYRPLSDSSTVKSKDDSMDASGLAKCANRTIIEVQSKRSLIPDSTRCERQTSNRECEVYRPPTDCEDRIRQKAEEFTECSWLSEDLDISDYACWNPISSATTEEKRMSRRSKANSIADNDTVTRQPDSQKSVRANSRQLLAK